MERRIVGTVKALYRYPVKSMGGHEIHEAAVGWHGFAGDRRYAFVRSGLTTSFPWLTARQVPEMVLYRPYFTDETNPAKSPCRVRTPSGRDLPVESEELRAELAARWSEPIHLMQMSLGIYDFAAVSVLSQSALDAFGEMLGCEVNARRVRPNIVVETAEGARFPEDGWVGGTLILGERRDAPQLRILKRIKRCVMVNVDPETSERDPRVLQAVTDLHEACAGVYGTPVATGIVRSGDVVFLER